ncbi:hypothetical protein L1049_013217 [Liquidambar formosana]|uniref:Helicase MAGATAMA 3 n=1 Tax=Liquidambar formosana TaxID=63359 RepID=A0AAP0RLK3_LIQFO
MLMTISQLLSLFCSKKSKLRSFKAETKKRRQNGRLGQSRNAARPMSFTYRWWFISQRAAVQYQQNDLLLLSKGKFEEGTELPSAYAFALVEHCQTNCLRLRMYLAGEVKRINVDEAESCPRLLKMRSLISEAERIFYMLKICSLSTIFREYVGLRSVGSLPFKDLILTAAENHSGSEDQAWKIPRPLMEFIETNHNASQLAAIHAGLSRKAFVLIQGPPGTGKTQTILGLLSAILHATPARVHPKGGLNKLKRGPELPIEDKYQHWGQASPWLTGINPRDRDMPIDGDDGFFPTTGNELKPEVVNSSRKYRVRVLVCAPSNSALDEIVLRLLNTGFIYIGTVSSGRWDVVRVKVISESKVPQFMEAIDEATSFRDLIMEEVFVMKMIAAYNPKIVRIGLKPHHSVKAVSLDHLVNQKVAGMSYLPADKHKYGAAGEDRDSIRSSVLDEAAIVFSTLSFSGSTLFSRLNRGFDVVIIDEAAQAVEPATLVPLANGCKQVFLIGDPVQLPATVISPIAENFGYGMSLFKRFQRAGYPVQMLKTQYRMHPEIRSFPSREFYAEALEDGPDVKDQTERLWHRYCCFGPFCFFDIHEGKESQPSGSGSWVNVDEVDFVLLMYHKLVTRYPELKSSARLAIISPYRHQVKLFRERFQDTFGVESDKVVDINTVDGFQGREKDVAIFSCVRASKDKGIGFVADFRRMNVGITRARSSVLVVGSASTLKKDGHWNNLVESAEKRNCLFKVSKPYTSFLSDENLDSMQVEDQSMTQDMEGQPDDVEYNAGAFGNPADADQGQADENDYGDGDGDGDDGGVDDD